MFSKSAQWSVAGFQMDPQHVVFGALTAREVPAGGCVEPGRMTVHAKDFRTFEFRVAAVDFLYACRIVVGVVAGNAIEAEPGPLRFEVDTIVRHPQRASATHARHRSVVIGGEQADFSVPHETRGFLDGNTFPDKSLGKRRFRDLGGGSSRRSHGRSLDHFAWSFGGLFRRERRSTLQREGKDNEDCDDLIHERASVLSRVWLDEPRGLVVLARVSNFAWSIVRHLGFDCSLKRQRSNESLSLPVKAHARICLGFASRVGTERALGLDAKRQGDGGRATVSRVR
jgi:hypothetical protein